MIQNLWDFITHNAMFTFLGAVTLVQIVPIKINPWSTVLKFVRKGLIGDLDTKMDKLEKSFEQNKVDTMRWNILDFANSCRNNRKHTKEEWNHCISQLKDYEIYCEERNIPNGQIEEDGKYLREIYHERSLHNDFL